MLFVAAAAFAWFDVLTHENILTNPELKTAGGWLMTGLMLLALGVRGWRRRKPTRILIERTRPLA